MNAIAIVSTLSEAGIILNVLYSISVAISSESASLSVITSSIASLIRHSLTELSYEMIRFSIILELPFLLSYVSSCSNLVASVRFVSGRSSRVS